MGFPKVTRLVLLGLGVVPLASVGCQSFSQMKTTVQKNLPAQIYSEPATQLICTWQRRPVPLPDAANDGSQVFGLPGQVYLLNSRGMPADVTGDVTIVVYDETKRPAGQEPRKPQVWHFTADVLKRLGTRDDRFGGCIAMFLPWPPEWRDVTDVHITGRYDSPGNPTLFERGAKVTLDFEQSGPKLWLDVDPTKPGQAPTVQTAAFETRTVPDPAMLMKRGQPTPAIQPTGGFTPTATTHALPPAPSMMLPPSTPTPPPASPNLIQPIIIQRQP